jgi:hypothetical protein
MAAMGGENERPTRRMRSERGGMSAVIMTAASAGLGAFIAVITDLAVKDDASAIIKISTICNRNLNLGLQTYWWALLVVGLGVALCIVYEPDTRPRAFGVGASIVALIATATPHTVRPTVAPSAPIPAVTRETQADPSWYQANFIIENERTVARPSQVLRRSYSYIDASEVIELALVIRVEEPFEPSEARLTFYRPDIDQIVRDVVFLSTRETRISVKIPVSMGRSDRNPNQRQGGLSHDNLYIRVEANGYHLLEIAAPLNDLPNGEIINVNLVSSFLPTPFDKLMRSYRY